MSPESMAALQQENGAGWRKVALTALAREVNGNMPRREVYTAVLEQLESPDKLSRFIKAHPELVSDLNPGLRTSIERLMIEGQGELQASIRYGVSGTAPINRIKALLQPTEEELALLRRAKEAEEGAAVLVSSSQEAVPRFLDHAFLEETASAERFFSEANKEVIFHAAFPEFKISKYLFQSHPEEWIGLLIEHGEFKLIRSTVTARKAQYVLQSTQAGGVEMTIFSAPFADARVTTMDLCYSFRESAGASSVPYRHRFVYLDDTIASHAIVRDGNTVLEKIFH